MKVIRDKFESGSPSYSLAYLMLHWTRSLGYTIKSYVHMAHNCPYDIYCTSGFKNNCPCRNVAGIAQKACRNTDISSEMNGSVLKTPVEIVGQLCNIKYCP